MYAVKIWLTLVHSIRSYDGSKNVEVFFEPPCIDFAFMLQRVRFARKSSAYCSIPSLCVFATTFTKRSVGERERLRTSFPRRSELLFSRFTLYFAVPNAAAYQICATSKSVSEGWSPRNASLTLHPSLTRRVKIQTSFLTVPSSILSVRVHY